MRHADNYIGQHIPDIEWQPKIQAEIQKCIEEERLKRAEPEPTIVP
jgi:hypothetical protein